MSTALARRPPDSGAEPALDGFDRANTASSPGAASAAAQPDNRTIARRLEEVATLLEEQGANRFRVRAYRAGAASLRQLSQSVSEIAWREGIEGLERLPDIGPTLARAIRDLVRSGRLPMLDRLRGETDPVGLLASVPGVGPVLAERLHHELGIGTLEDLEAAAHDGRLATIAGVGPKRLAGIIDSLAGRLGRPRPLSPPEQPPPVAELLDVDREYRTKAEGTDLPRIAPRRFNPRREAWLPVLHTVRDPHHYTALFSNTARAHQLRRTHDWVVLYYDGGRSERQCTVVTERRGPLSGKRVVRGREGECLDYYHVRRPAAVAAARRSGEREEN